MIIVTRINGTEIVVNADLIETIEATPDTVLTLVDGPRDVVEDAPSILIERVAGFRAAVIRLADEPMDTSMAGGPERRTAADVVTLHSRTEE